MNNQSNLFENSDIFKEATNNKKHRDGRHDNEKSYEASRPYEIKNDAKNNKNDNEEIIKPFDVLIDDVHITVFNNMNALSEEKDSSIAKLHRNCFPNMKRDVVYRAFSCKGCLPVNFLLELANQRGITLTSLITGTVGIKEQPYDIDDVFAKIKEAFKTTSISDLDFKKTVKKYNGYDIQQMKQKLRLSIFLKLCFWMQLPQDKNIAQDYEKYNYELFIS